MGNHKEGLEMPLAWLKDVKKRSVEMRMYRMNFKCKFDDSHNTSLKRTRMLRRRRRF
jgi:hypothetical protein